jgi:hypothetical protein
MAARQYGMIVLLRSDGRERARFPLVEDHCSFGR